LAGVIVSPPLNSVVRQLDMKYIRIQTRYLGKLGKPVGIFGACHHLQRAGKLTIDEAALFKSIDDWFIANLPLPYFYADGNAIKAITWFKKDETVEMILRLQPLVKLLEKYNVDYDLIESDEPGTKVYEDEYQVGTI
jgi:hypothetical protein